MARGQASTMSLPAEADARFSSVVPSDLSIELTARGYGGAERWSVLRRLLLAADVVAGTVAGIVGAALGGIDIAELMLATVAVAFAWPAISFVCGLYSADDLGSWASGVGEVSRTAFAALFLSWPLYALAGLLDSPTPAIAALAVCISAPCLGGASRALARAIAHTSEPLRQRTVIVGSGMVAGRVVEKLKEHPQFGLVPIGIVDDDVHYQGHPDLLTLGRLDELSDILDRSRVDRVIIAFSRANHDQLLSSLRACRDRRVAVDVVPRLFEFLDGARVLDQIGGLPLLSIGAHRLSVSSRAAKRALDVLVSGLGLLVLAPLLAVIPLAIKLDSRGSVLFRQTRPGREGKPFDVVKFRSMYADAAGHAPDVDSEGAIVKGRDDPRITRVGELLRRFSLDELPQLINVLKGDMSLVGPRPLVMAEIQALGENWHERRLDLKPGMTGLWQVSGRSSTSFHERLRFDYQYVAGWSLARDIEILLHTLPAVVSGRGAY